MSKEKGFTIIEFLLIIAICGIMAAVAIPNFVTQIPKYRLSGAARQLKGDLMWARAQAVSQNNRFKVFFLNDHEYKILDDDDNDGSIDTGETTETKNIQDKFHDVTLSSTGDPTFYPKGNASPTATITLSNSAGSKDVETNLTGRVKIE